MVSSTVERLRALMAEAAASPGKTVTIPADLTAELAAESSARTREAILEIRRREYMPSRDGPPPAWVTAHGVEGRTK
jgi:hypothetical protein